MKRNLLVLVFALMGFGAATQATSLDDAYHEMCEKLKYCALKDVAESDLSPEMRAMILQSMEGACVSIQQQFANVASAHPLYVPASACMESMAALSCEEIESRGDQSTPECARYEKMAATAP
ncbi:MAG: hypothetical protein P1U47_11810 [Zhongshania sp.]|uniref:hypothetical protein n=1 Tax=Zhongshania sp. TaxID=1971902 RepID=UPI0026293BAE|nr:hypothetical protein [Zhongshania sp.]MDF1693056.1 hypothetical protein [Zhongshania sp.]